MSISKRWLKEQKNVEQVLKLYRSVESPTLQDIADQLQTTYHNVVWVCKNKMPEAEYKALSAIRYARSKTAEKNPMYGKSGEAHHNWIGLVDDGYGYLTCLKDGKRQFVHRIVMAEALSMKAIPAHLDVHHIDGDTKNNNLDNLALVTRKGHQIIHSLQRKDTLSILLKKSHLREALKYMTSR